MTLQPYQKDRPCPKCGQKGAETLHLPSRRGDFLDSTDCERRTEHLHRWCPNCKYEWCEALAVTPVNSEGLTPEQVALDG